MRFTDDGALDPREGDPLQLPETAWFCADRHFEGMQVVYEAGMREAIPLGAVLVAAISGAVVGLLLGIAAAIAFMTITGGAA